MIQSIPFSVLHTLTGVLVLLFFAVKVILHGYNDYKQVGYSVISYAMLKPLPYFLPYKAPEHIKNSRLPRLCNLFLWLTAAALLLNLGFGIAPYLI